MSDPKDRLFRHLALLRLIPRAPKSISTTELLQRLKAENFNIDRRTLQRDLIGRLALDFPLLCDESQRPYLWSFPKDTPQFDFPALDTPTALAFVLAEGHLSKLLPPSVLNLLAHHFDLAHRQLQGLEHNNLSHWVRRVRTLPNGKALQPAEVDAAIWSEVATALLETRQLKIVYLSRSKGEHKTLRIHPAGLISRHSVSYLVGTVEGYTDVRQFALHRIQQAACLNVPTREQPGFEIDHYIQSGGFNSPGPVEQHELIADVSPHIAWLLNETPLSPEQSLKPLPDSDWQRLRAKVPDDQETFWWVFGLGESVRLHEPKHWVDAIKERLIKMGALYTQPIPHHLPTTTNTHACQETP
ncbi:WYL domain-containing protein [Pseudomonas aeruginosa]|uniref:helix-turn-helix transcriptional regulator n=1 Tax=Pseudomonas aeruginosa TaxID=287 RepID=UPI0012408011|nr:WYL domain-containing protein [Pseudomonas aeruginosa]MDI3667759.1 WYL domain-containing protein [Pseudomonas aeruginosa]MDV7918887.1 WYL domain-containing protein [Pseudomonas aeruginosa]HBN8287764.1 WYL domain-containing protein [Pseudomonas aeruginosa]HBN8289005.1 WYL domain-containing protein [Pseudomonas aeruginosa]